jgi:CRISPR-associated protein Cmr2
MTHLFLFTIGPVQGFIAQARKTRDLYAGSRLLSDLVFSAMNCAKIFSGDKAQFIFPAWEDSTTAKWNSCELISSEASYPNRFLALIHSTEIQAFGQRLETSMRDLFVEVAKKHYKNYLGEAPQAVLDQARYAMEFHWAAITYEVGKDAYGTTYSKLEQLLGMTKQVRSLDLLKETGRKCSVDGERNVMVYRRDKQDKSDDQLRRNKLWDSNNIVKILPYDATGNQLMYRHVAGGEGLSAISLLKRLYRDNEAKKFPSTAGIALHTILNDNRMQEALRQYKSHFEGDMDEQLLYADNLTLYYFQKHGVNISSSLDSVREEQRTLFKQAKDCNLPTSKYYALLQFDGDSMGEWLSKTDSVRQHEAFSKLLTQFAQDISLFIKDYGRTIYAGGDDFLGLVKVDGVFELVKEIRKKFQDQVTKHVPFRNGNKQFTISISVVIAHYKAPLNRVIQLSHDLLKRTKERFAEPLNDFDQPKNGVGITFMVPGTILGETFLQKEDDLETLSRLYEHFLPDAEPSISSSFFTKYIQAISALPMTGLEYEEMTLQQEILISELKRLLKRSVESEQKDPVLKTFIEDQGEKGLATFLRRQIHKTSDGYHIDLENFRSFLKIALKTAQQP